jgi:hypothetical protein
LDEDVIMLLKEHPFTVFPSTPSRIDPGILKDTNMALLTNIQQGIFDTPIRAFILKLAIFAEYLSIQILIANRKN